MDMDYKLKSKVAKEKFWLEHYENWQKSGLNQTRYCRENNILEQTFRYYKQKLIENKNKQELVELTPRFSTGITRKASSNLEVVINNSYRIKIPDNFKPETLQILIKTLEGLA